MFHDGERANGHAFHGKAVKKVTSEIFRTIVEGEDDGQRFLVTYDVVCDDVDEIEPILRVAADRDGWAYQRIEDSSSMGPTPTRSGSFREVTGRTYFERD